jgi:transcriptional regulator with XRE-family HTH domain
MKGNNTLIHRVSLAIPEQRRELDLSLSELARVSGVSRSTLTRVERGGRVGDALVVKVASALLALELHAPPAPIESATAMFAGWAA